LKYIFISHGTVQGINIEQQEKVVPLYELYGMFKGYEKIPEIFRAIAQKKKREKDKQSAENKTVWKNRIRLEYGKKRLSYDLIDTGTLRIRPTTASPDDPEPIFTVLNGNFNETDPEPLFEQVGYIPDVNKPLLLA
jgi:hypothetical protein